MSTTGDPVGSLDVTFPLVGRYHMKEASSASLPIRSARHVENSQQLSRRQANGGDDVQELERGRK